MSNDSSGFPREGGWGGKRQRGAVLGQQRRGTWRRGRGGVLRSRIQPPATLPPHRPMQPAAAGAEELFERHPPIAHDTGPRMCQPGSPTQGRSLRRCWHDHRYRRPPRPLRRRRRARRRRPHQRLSLRRTRRGGRCRARRTSHHWYCVDHTCNMPSVTERTSAGHEQKYCFFPNASDCPLSKTHVHPALAGSLAETFQEDERTIEAKIISLRSCIGRSTQFGGRSIKRSCRALRRLPIVVDVHLPPDALARRSDDARIPIAVPVAAGPAFSPHTPLLTPCVPRC